MTKAEMRDMFGGGNDFPPHWKEISDQAFWNRWFAYSWTEIDWRQMNRPHEVFDKYYEATNTPANRRHMVTARLFIYNDATGLAITSGYSQGKYTPRFFEFGVCMHNNREPVLSESRMCYHVTICSDCGRKFSVDSSG